MDLKKQGVIIPVYEDDRLLIDGPLPAIGHGVPKDLAAQRGEKLLE
jgi:hypothetical protein